MDSAPLHIKFFADENRQVRIVCPKCAFKRTIDGTPYTKLRRPMKIGCKCKAVFHATIEFRKAFRKQVMLAGEYLDRSTGERGDMLVKNISMHSLGFTPISAHTLTENSLVFLSFTLDNPKRSLVKRKAVVKSIRDDVVGAEFLKDQPEDSDLNFYLLR
ncbi:MAG: hypothetical protein ACLFTB_06870 [Desulfovibrionales bacterium]